MGSWRDGTLGDTVAPGRTTSTTNAQVGQAGLAQQECSTAGVPSHDDRGTNRATSSEGVRHTATAAVEAHGDDAAEAAPGPAATGGGSSRWQRPRSATQWRQPLGGGSSSLSSPTCRHEQSGA
jgi:hypothetical protein